MLCGIRMFYLSAETYNPIDLLDLTRLRKLKSKSKKEARTRPLSFPTGIVRRVSSGFWVVLIGCTLCQR